MVVAVPRKEEAFISTAPPKKQILGQGTTGLGFDFGSPGLKKAKEGHWSPHPAGAFPLPKDPTRFVNATCMTWVCLFVEGALLGLKENQEETVHFGGPPILGQSHSRNVLTFGMPSITGPSMGALAVAPQVVIQRPRLTRASTFGYPISLAGNS